MSITLDRPLYLDAAKAKIVEEGDPEARFVLGVKGTVISDEDAKFYGLDKYLAGPLKAIQPTQNKMQTPPANKGK